MTCMLMLGINHKKVNLIDFIILFLLPFLLWWITVKICSSSQITLKTNAVFANSYHNGLVQLIQTTQNVLNLSLRENM